MYNNRFSSEDEYDSTCSSIINLTAPATFFVCFPKSRNLLWRKTSLNVYPLAPKQQLVFEQLPTLPSNTVCSQPKSDETLFNGNSDHHLQQQNINQQREGRGNLGHFHKRSAEEENVQPMTARHGVHVKLSRSSLHSESKEVS